MVNPLEFDVCPDCGLDIQPEGGCVFCPSCGWSGC
jgi:hypothetical protein